MQQNIKYTLQSSLLLIWLFTFAFVAQSNTPSVFAASTSPSASAKTSPSPSPAVSPSPISETQITESLKERLKDTINSLEPAAPSTTIRAYIGRIRDVIQKNLILDTKDGKKQVILTDDTTLLRSPGNAAIKPDSILLEDYIIAIGNTQENDVIVGKRLIVSTSPLSEMSKVTGYGQITAINKSSLTLTISGQEKELEIDADTIIKTKSSADLSLADISLNSRLIYTATKTKSSELATVIMVLQ